jgi:hypothetical protein
MASNALVRGLNISSGGATGITGSGATALTVAEVSVTSTTGTAVSFTGATGSSLSFTSVSSNGAANGIFLSNTSGSFAVTGTGTPGSGGTIQQAVGADGTTAGSGVYLSNASNVSLAWMQLNDFQNFAIRGVTVDGFSLANSTINATGAGKNGTSDIENEGSISFSDLTGTASITSSTIEDGFEDVVRIVNTSGTLSLTVTGSTIRDTSTAAPGNDGLLLQADGTATINATITTSTFTGARANGVQVVTNNAGIADVDIGTAAVANSGGTFQTNNIGVNLAHNSSGTFNFNVLNASFSQPTLTTASSPINVNLGSAVVADRGPMSGNIVGNTISNNNSTTGPGIRVIGNGTDTDGSNVLTVKIDGNTVSAVANFGIQIVTRDGNSTVNATVTNNVVTTATASAQQALRADAGAASGDSGTLNLDAHGNTLITDPLSGLTAIRVRQRFNTTYRIEDYLGPQTADATVAAYLTSINNAATAVADHAATGSNGFLNINDVPEPPAP